MVKKISIETMIDMLRYKAENIKAHIEPQFFNDVADELEKHQWIDVNDRLPEDDERYKDEDLITVLATLNNGEIALITRYAWFEDYGYEWCWKNFKEIVAWMPLPEPYKRGEC